MSEPEAILELREVSCQRGSATLTGVSLSFFPSTISLIVGDGGADLLLKLIGLQERPDAGEVRLEDLPVSGLPDSEVSGLRSRKYGFLFASPYLLPGLSVAENVAMPLFKLMGDKLEPVARQTDAILEFVGLADRLREEAGTLDWPEQYRLSLARALAHAPRVLLLDQVEFHLALDQAAAFWALVEQACRRFSLAAVVLASRQPSPCRADRILTIDSGVVSEFGAPAAS